MTDPFVDIHCHLLPAIDDGSSSLQESLAMARMAVGDGIKTIIATPHQLGTFVENHGDDIRRRVAELQAELDVEDIPLRVLPGGDVRIEDGMIAGLRSGEVMSLGDHRKHVLLELPHELYMPLEPVLAQLAKIGMIGILSHPERNQGILRQPELLKPLVDGGCLMQVTANSLIGAFGPTPQVLAEQMVSDGLVHFMASDAHNLKSRRPKLGRAFNRVAELAGQELAIELCCTNPARVAAGKSVKPGRRKVSRPRRTWFGFGKVAG